MKSKTLGEKLGYVLMAIAYVVIILGIIQKVLGE